MPIPRLKTIDNDDQILDYDEMIKRTSINLEKHYDKPPIVIEVVLSLAHFRFGTLGNFSVIGGKGKAGKTFVISSIIGSAISDSKVLNFLCSFNKKNVVLLDTEQSKYDLYYSAKRSVKLNGQEFHPANYDIHGLRELSPEDRLFFIENYLEKNKNIGLVVIDGIRDLIIDVNNPHEATNITTKIMQWSSFYNIHIIVVLHENPGSDKLRGHLGTELMNKAEMVVSVEKPPKNDSISIIKSKYARGTKPFPEFAFCINDQNLPELYENYESAPF